MLAIKATAKSIRTFRWIPGGSLINRKKGTETFVDPFDASTKITRASAQGSKGRRHKGHHEIAIILDRLTIADIIYAGPRFV